jgi:hypothetical protein
VTFASIAPFIFIANYGRHDSRHDFHPSIIMIPTRALWAKRAFDGVYRLPKNVLAKRPQLHSILPVPKCRRVNSCEPWLHIQFEIDPGPNNIITNPSGNKITDQSHPVYYKMQQKMLDFNQNQLHWSVMVSTALHKKPTIRHRVKRRFKQAIKDLLRELGYNEVGEPDAKAANENIHGTILVVISAADPWAAREYPWPKVQALARWTLDTFLRARGQPDKLSDVEAEARRKRLTAEEELIRTRVGIDGSTLDVLPIRKFPTLPSPEAAFETEKLARTDARNPPIIRKVGFDRNLPPIKYHEAKETTIKHQSRRDPEPPVTKDRAGLNVPKGIADSFYKFKPSKT